TGNVDGRMSVRGIGVAYLEGLGVVSGGSGNVWGDDVGEGEAFLGALVFRPDGDVQYSILKFVPLCDVAS
ncbi:hypothetical protein U1Q18_010869, partial [Sarracenia purpurea var. burkii]